MRKLIILSIALMMISSIPTAMAAITVDGHKSPGEWNENWAFGQLGTTYDPWTPGDRMQIWQQGVWLDEDPPADAGTLFNENLSTVGPHLSGYDIHRVYAHYDPSTDTLYGLCEVYGIPGDLDGNGNVATLEDKQDRNGTAGPAGEGVGEYEYWHLKLYQDGKSTTIVLSDNNWSIATDCLTYGDVETKFTSDEYDPNDPDALPKSVYEVKMTDISDCFSLGPGDELKIEIIAGGSGDTDPVTGGVLGEDIAIVEVKCPVPDINIVKYVQGNDGVWYDANTPATGPEMDNGSAVSWEYKVTNTGTEPLENVVVTDDQPGVIVDCGGQDTLDVGETMTCTATGTVSDPCVPYANMGDVKGVGVVSGIEVTDMDPAHYRCRDIPALTPAGLMALIGILGMIGIVGLKRRD